MLALTDFSFEFAGRYLYRNANWHIKPNEKIGLVGLNGTGKSTLLRLISGEYELREGQMSKSNQLKIGFLNQDLLSVEFDESVRDVVLSGREDLVKLDTEIHQLLKEIETNYDDEQRLNRLGEVQEQFGQLGGYDWQSQGEKILEGLGFPTDWLGRPLKELSGGWRMRAILGRLLLMAPDLLLLDEPTNHLDLPTIQWLESYLQEYQGTYVIVSHDRYFLNRTVNRIAEVAHQQIFHYKGNFNSFLEQKEERDELLQRQFENQQDFIKQQMNFISRFRYKASKAAAVQSRVKQLEKMDRIELQEKETRDFDIKFNIRIKSGKVVVDLKDVGKSYGDLEILQNAEAQVIRGDKIALIGANGKGKSTLLRMLVGNETHTGSIEEGWNVESAFFAQHQLEALNLKNDLLNEIGTVSSEYTEKELRTVLGCFLFTGEDVFKKVKVLSGGEKSRLALAKTLITQSNFLLLDEPTNHLDMFSSSVLAESLDNYAGAVLFVSHDRTFISRVATKVWWIEEGKIKEYPGTYDEYKEWMGKREKEAMISVNSAVQTPQTKKEAVGDDKSKLKPTTVSKNKLRHWEQEMAKFEQKLNTLDETIKKTESQLLEPEIASDADKVWELTQEHQKWSNERESIQKQHDEIMEQWIDAQ
ncbi:ATP-binding cassette domain-containing protein [Bacteroidia bacterium]|nr:ATP-binding cassette domain-containing protein [Bacteroidia bacterium]MDA9213722.1 ATP-binding cassette domain-containing protein [Bacteroidia bacterium]